MLNSTSKPTKVLLKKLWAAHADLAQLLGACTGFFEVDAPLDWIGISPGGVPAVKDTSGEPHR